MSISNGSTDFNDWYGDTHEEMERRRPQSTWSLVEGRTVLIVTDDDDDPLLLDAHGVMQPRYLVEQLIAASQRYLELYTDEAIEGDREREAAEERARFARMEREREARPDFRAGVVYLIKAGEHFKIGRTPNIDKRKKFLQIQVPFEVQVIHTIKTSNTFALESHWHRYFKPKRIGRTEWFTLSPDDVAEFCAQDTMEVPS